MNMDCLYVDGNANKGFKAREECRGFIFNPCS